MKEGRFAWMLAAFACAGFVCGGPGAARADLIPSTPVSRPLADASATGRPAPLARQAVADRLAAIGLSAADIDSRMAELTDADAQTLAAAPDQFQMAGMELKEYSLVLAIIVVICIAALTVLGIKLSRSHGDHDRGEVPTPLEPGPPPI